MLIRILSAAFVAFLFQSATPASALANDCGQGYIEQLDRRGQPHCVAEARHRANLLRQQQMLRVKQMRWQAELQRSRQAQFVVENQRRGQNLQN